MHVCFLASQIQTTNDPMHNLPLTSIYIYPSYIYTYIQQFCKAREGERGGFCIGGRPDFYCVTPPVPGNKVQYMACTPGQMEIGQHMAKRIGTHSDTGMGPIPMEQHLHSQGSLGIICSHPERPSPPAYKPMQAAPQPADRNSGRICPAYEFCAHRGLVMQNQPILTTKKIGNSQ